MSKFVEYLLKDMQKMVDYYRERNEILSNEVDRLKDQQEIYKKALHFYGNPNHYGDRGEFWRIVIDEGKTARKALESGGQIGCYSKR